MKQNQIREKIDEVADILAVLKVHGIDNELFNRTLDELPVCLWVHDENHSIIFGNRCFKENFGAFQKQTCHQCLMGEENVCSCCSSKKTLENEKSERCKLCKRRDSGYDLNVFHMPIINKDDRNFIITSSLHLKDIGILVGNHLRKSQDTAWGNIWLCAH